MSDAPMHALDAPSPAGLSPEEKLVWILGDLMNAVENYFGCENPKRLGHINQAAIRIIDEVLNAAAPATTTSGGPVAWLRVRDDGRQTFWERNVDGACTPLYTHPAPTVSGDAKEIVDRLRRASGDARRLCLDAAMMIEYLAGKKAMSDLIAAAKPVAWRWRLKYQNRDEWTDWQVTASRRDYGGPDVRIEEQPLYTNPSPTLQLAKARESLEPLLQQVGDSIADAIEQMLKGNWRDDHDHDVRNNVKMIALKDTLNAIMAFRTDRMGYTAVLEGEKP